MTCFCEHGGKISDFIKSGKFVGHINNKKLQHLLFTLLRYWLMFCDIQDPAFLVRYLFVVPTNA